MLARIFDCGFSSDFGRAFDAQNPLAGLILEGAAAEGETVAVSAHEGGLMINGKRAEAA